MTPTISVVPGTLLLVLITGAQLVCPPAVQGVGAYLVTLGGILVRL
ncbi:hypothetical protein [Pseudomonas massiliensis]|nr:hypothetical protein [Pseudomonas massiliensis]